MIIKSIVMLLFIKHSWSVELKSCNSSLENQLCKLQQFYDKTKVPGRIPITLTPSIFDILEVSEVNVIEKSSGRHNFPKSWHLTHPNTHST